MRLRASSRQSRSNTARQIDVASEPFGEVKSVARSKMLVLSKLAVVERKSSLQLPRCDRQDYRMIREADDPSSPCPGSFEGRLARISRGALAILLQDRENTVAQELKNLATMPFDGRNDAVEDTGKSTQ